MREGIPGRPEESLVSIEQLAVTLTAELDSVTIARHFVRRAAQALRIGVDADVAELLVSELVANAIELRAGEVSVTAERHHGTMRVSVRDHGYGRPETSHPAPLDFGGGRGLLIVDTLSDSWGVDEFLPGKIVWFELLPRTDAAVDGSRAPVSPRR
jgi:anti-sigma regulatory factor (Ser/Thr protein kinase)